MARIVVPKAPLPSPLDQSLLLGTDILCIVSFLNRNKNGQNCRPKAPPPPPPAPWISHCSWELIFCVLCYAQTRIRIRLISSFLSQGSLVSNSPRQKQKRNPLSGWISHCSWELILSVYSVIPEPE